MLSLLGEAAGRTLLLAVVVQCSLWLLQVRQVRTLLLVWSVVLAASLAMPGLPHLTPFRVAVDVLLPAGAIGNRGGDGSSDVVGHVASDPMGNGLTGGGDAPARVPVDAGSPEVWPQLSALPWLEGVYLLVSVAIAFRVLLGVGLSFRLLARAVPVRTGWADGVRVRISRDVTAPVTIGGTVVLPSDAAGWSAEIRRAVLAHERAHVARWDFALLLVSQLNKAVFWFSPVPWWLHRRLTVLSEMASDDYAMAVTEDPVGYAAVLLEMGRRSGAASGGPAMARPATLALRIERILRDEPVCSSFDRPLHFMLTVAVPGLSLAVASLVLDPIARPVVVPFTPVVATPEIIPEIIPGPPLPTVRDDKVDGAPAVARQELVHGTPTVFVPLPALPRTVTAQRPASTVRPALHLPPRAVAHSAAPSRPVVREARNDAAVAQETPRGTGDADRAASAGLPASAAVPPSARPWPRLDFAAMMESTCSGSILVGPRWREMLFPHPDITGRVVAAQARFFRKNGASWVRFFAFGRPPLDVPVQVTRDKATWTGEYGISYVVQPFGDNRLVGLAALGVGETAKLDFTCQVPAE